MDASGDDLAGIADLFGGLTRPELDRAVAELAFKRGADVDGVPDETVEQALSSYRLVAVDRDGERLFVPGPAAFPALPDGAEDLPHIMDVDERSIDREAVAAAARNRLADDVAAAVDADDSERAAELLDVTYDLEAWADADVAELRERLDGVG